VRRIWPIQIDAWVADMTASGVSPAKIVGAHGVLRRLLDRAVRDRVIHVNPCALRETPLPRLPLRERPILTPSEVERLAQAMRRDDDKVLVHQLAYGGLRIGEALPCASATLTRFATP
jgi:integrase